MHALVIILKQNVSLIMLSLYLTSASIRSLCSLGQLKAVLRTFLVAPYANR